MRIRGPLIAAIAAIFPAVSAFGDIARPGSLEDTLELMRAGYEATGLFDAVEIDRGDRSIRLSQAGSEVFTSYPDNLHQMLVTAETDADRQTVLDDFIASLVEHLASLDEPDDIAMLVPVVRHRDFAAEAGAEGPVLVPLVGDLAIFYAFDRPRSVSYVTPDDLESLELTLEDLPGIAAANLERLGWAPEIEGSGIWFLVFDGNYETTFLLDEEMWNGFDEQLDRVIMMALARDLVLFSDASFEGAEDEMRRIAAENWDELSYPLSNLMYEWSAEGWIVRP